MSSWSGAGYQSGWKNGMPTGNPDPFGQYSSINSKTGVVMYNGNPGPSQMNAYQQSGGYKDGKWQPPPGSIPQQSQSGPAPIDWAKLLAGSNNASPSAGAMNIQTSIQARPITTPTQVNAALSRYSSGAPQTAGPLSTAAQGLYAQEAESGAMGAARGFAAANRNHEMESQIARSGSGINWGQLGSRAQNAAANQQLNQQQQALSLLRALGVV